MPKNRASVFLQTSTHQADRTNVKRSLLDLFLQPVRTSTRTELRRRWDALPPALQTKRQIYASHEEGCGATVGAMPRCNFACKGCYLTDQANTVPPMAMDAVKRQLDQLREFLGPWGNLQLTDGELTLRPADELIELIRYAREIELIPMLMTHGDTFRRQPGLLERLMTEGGLDEMSLHIDTTQRGRIGYKRVTREFELNPLRAEFAEIVRDARRRTGLPLRVATTITTTPAMVDEIPSILAELFRHPDVYRLITFLPIAQVGRTLEGHGGGLSSDQVWERISATLGFDANAYRWHYGHASCNRFVMGWFVERKGRFKISDLKFQMERDEPNPLKSEIRNLKSPAPTSCELLPFSMVQHPEDDRFIRAFLDRFGGITFRADRGLRGPARALGMFVRAPWLLSVGVLRYAWIKLGRIAVGSGSAGGRLRTAFGLVTGRIKLHRMTVGTHHFMSRDEVESPEGKERIEQCIFKVPDGDEMVSMCTFNTQGGRERLYARLRNRDNNDSKKDIPDETPNLV